MKIAMIHYRNLAILNGEGNLAADALFAGEAAREGGAGRPANKVSDRIFPLLGDTAQTGLQLGGNTTPVIKRKLLEQVGRVCLMY
jgi:hypothetical protein